MVLSEDIIEGLMVSFSFKSNASYKYHEYQVGMSVSLHGVGIFWKGLVGEHIGSGQHVLGWQVISTGIHVWPIFKMGRITSTCTRCRSAQPDPHDPIFNEGQYIKPDPTCRISAQAQSISNIKAVFEFKWQAKKPNIKLGPNPTLLNRSD